MQITDKFEIVKIAEIKPDDRNGRKHSDEHIIWILRYPYRFRTEAISLILIRKKACSSRVGCLRCHSRLIRNTVQLLRSLA